MLGIVLQTIRTPRPLHIDEPLGAHLPEFASRGAERGTVRLRHVLSHATGHYWGPLTDARSSEDRSERGVALPASVFPPGAWLYYDSTDTLLLARVLVRHTGQSVSDLIEHRIVAPLQINTDGANVQPLHDVVGHIYDDSLRAFVPLPRVSQEQDDLRMALPVLIAACRTFLYCGAGSALPEMLSVASRLPPAIGGVAAPRIPQAFSLGWGIFETGLYGLNGIGAGQCCAVRFDPDRRICFAVGLPVPDIELREQIIELMQQGLELPARSPTRADELQVTDDTAPLLTGDYEGYDLHAPTDHKITAQVIRVDDRLEIRLREGQRVVPALTLLHRKHAGHWIAGDGAKLLPVRFLRSDGAKALGMMIGANALWRPQMPTS